MKIVELRLKNLNSLYGDWVIDFTAADYVNNGIFAITGRTGAGKSTIMDAICLALYGRTPRLNIITGSSNEIMSRNTGECSAEITFASQAGTYRCTWSQHRAYKKPDGRLAEPKHEIVDAITNKVIEAKKSRTVKAIAEYTGMDFERFTRSMLLAQGGFAAFLQANAGERAPILEQITGTEIYSKISCQTYKRFKEEEAALQYLEAETKGITILSPAEEEELQKELILLKKEETVQTGLASKVEKAVKWWDSINGLKSEIEKLTHDASIVARELADFQPQKEKLNQAVKAAELDGEYSTLLSVRTRQKEDAEKLAANQKKLPDLQKQLAEKEKLQIKAETEYSNAKEKLKTSLPTIKKVRQLDLQSDEKQKYLNSLKNDLKKAQKQIKEGEKKLKKISTQLAVAGEEIKELRSYAEKNEQDKTLVSEFSAVKELLNNLQKAEAEIEAARKQLSDAEVKTNKAKSAFKKLKDSLEETKATGETLQMKVQQEKERLAELLKGRALHEYREEKDALLHNLADIQKVHKLEEQRKMLADDKPCPLCGSLDHPYVRGKLPKANETERQIKELTAFIKDCEATESKISAQEKVWQEWVTSFNVAEKEHAKAGHQLAESSNEAKRLAREFEKSEKELEQIRSVTLNKLKPLGVEDLPASEFTAFVGALESRLDKWQKNLTALEESEKQISRLQNDEKSQAGVIELLKDSLNEKVVLIDQTEGLCEEITAQRHELFADKNPDREEEQLEKAVEKHEATAGEQREAKEACLHQTQQIKTIITTLKDEVEKRQPLLAKQEESFVASLKQQGFADEKNFVASRLGTAERQALAQRAKQLEDHHAEILANKKDRSARLAGEIELKLSTEPLEELQERQQQFKETLQQLTLRTGALKQQLEDNKRAKSLLKDKLALISSQKRELQRWEMLNKLIGSESGRKYQKFAQSLTFELLIAHANQQLITLSDRYLLMQDQENALELCVIDNYQAGEERSTKNLSGGESFIVSLALALGLSQMASRNVRVDSLFLDEGFGTLDEDALESALTTLANLHQEGKLIGVISHVPVLKDRISTQINVVAGDGGKSTLSGPGCARA